MATTTLPPEIQVVADELKKSLRMSRNGRVRVLTWFNLNSGKQHFYMLRKAKNYQVYAHFYSASDLIAWCERHRIEAVDMTEVTYRSTTKMLAEL